MADLEKGYQEWKENKLDKTVNNYGERKDQFSTGSNRPVKALYSPLDVEDIDYLEEINFPGQFPYTRGVYPTMYRSRLWTMRQYAGFGTAKETNERFRYLLDHGQTGLSVAFDLPTQIGYDSDHEMSKGEVGRVGVAIDTLADMETLFDQIPLDKVSTSMTINAPASVLLAMYIAVAEKQGVEKEKLSGTIQNDILKEYIARGTYIFPPEPSLRLITDIFDYCSKELPSWNTISISGYHIREAGSDAVQELAFTIADGIEYVESALSIGMDVDSFAPRLSFFFNGQMDFLEEVAKFRAARRLWAEIMKDRFGAEKAKSCMLRFHTQTAGAALTAQQPQNNIVRVAIQALAAVLGGTQSLHTNSFDEALGLPTEEAAKIALRTQQIIAEESGVADTIDPLAGSYYIESMTDKLVEEAREYLDEIEELGGMAEAIKAGYVQREIQESAYQEQKAVESGEKAVIGVNKHKEDSEEIGDILKVDPNLEKDQCQQLSEIRADRDSDITEKHLEDIRNAAINDKNLMYPILDAVRDYVSIGEICGVLREEFGEYEAKIF
ncbi:methylmalonyl-CoA mutase family protein [Halanaerobiaceae bacterium Z-7014]|uniref:methylmalonyl-CoA mutase n=1 Tax=Halonatronomonas betaini TaxID=2778430 RepID=A0A931AVD8_9FIRM|nr:methylmalonyl-CoA mutase family protein [Halonatronomonas betaini]MBF8437180.1 methylmalonyl-CoA mutase family protein [Halonatronomonas betaini]